MDDSSKKIVMIITAAALGIMAVMAFNNYNQPAPDNTEAAVVSEPAPVETVPAVKPSPTQSSAPMNDGPTNEDIPAINGAPSMILDNVNGYQNDQGNKDAPAPADNVQ